MSGMINASGLITGIDSGALIAQLMQLERQPIVRIQERISGLEGQQAAVRSLRTQLQTLRNRLQDFRLSNVFAAFESSSSEESVLTTEISSSAPLTGSFEVDVTQLASSTVAESSAVMGDGIDPNAALDSSGLTAGIEAGTFSVNGVQFTVDPTTDSLNSILATITATTAAGVTASYDAGTDKVVFENTTGGDTSIINFGASDDTSNFLSGIAITEATQSTNGSGSTEVTSTSHLGSVDPVTELNNVAFVGGATVSTGSFSINGISISVDPSTDALGDVLERINSSDANVTATYDASADTIRVVSNTLGSRTINFGGTGDSSNFLTVANLDTATQTAGNDAQFTINGGAVQTRNTNEVSDAISGVTLTFLSTGTSTVTSSADEDTIVESVQEFIDAYNTAVTSIRTETGNEGTLRGDGGIRGIENFLMQNIFSQVSGISGEFESLVDIGITSGEDFDATTGMTLSLDEDAFREALRDNRTNVQNLFANVDDTGIADTLFSYLDEITKATGFLNNRAKANGTIDQQIRNLNDQIGRMEDRLLQRENRLRRQFTHLEQISAGFQNQSSALAGLGAF